MFTVARDYMRQEPKLHFEFYQRHITDGAPAPRKPPVDMCQRASRRLSSCAETRDHGAACYWAGAWRMSTTMHAPTYSLNECDTVRGDFVNPKYTARSRQE